MTTRSLIRFQKGFRFQLVEDWLHRTPFRLNKEVDTPFIKVTTDGLMTVKRGYAWDGRSGLIRRKKTKMPSLFHDAAYQLIRQRQLYAVSKTTADRHYVKMLKANKVAKWYANFDGWMLKRFGEKAATKPKKVFEA
ncbi:MAG: hypothetical protein V3V85_06735 [Candidatus Thorarchaeota archaeon]